MVVFHVQAWCLRRPEEIPWDSCIEMVVSFHVCAEIKPRTPGGAASALSHLAIYPALGFPFREN